MRLSRSFTIAVLVLASASVWAQERVVYHFDNAATQGLKGLRNMRNHLDVEPTAKLVAVAHAEGVDMLMEGAKAANGADYAALISALAARGVVFEICEITLKNRSLKKEAFIQEASFTPSGVARVARLQFQGAAYIKP